MKPIVVVSSLVCAVAIAAATVAVAQEVGKSQYALLSDKYGDPGYVGLMPGYGQRSIDDPLDAFEARSMSAPEIGALFQRLCLDKPFDSTAYAAAREAVAADFLPTVRTLQDFSAPKPLLGSYNVAGTALSQNFSRYGITSLWLGEEAEKLNKRPYARFSGSLIITGPFDKKEVYAPQCNLTLKVSGLATAKALLDTVQAALPGYAGVKRVEKPKYGYAIWTGPRIDGRVPRVTATANKLNKPEQTVHLTIQLLPAGMAK